MSDERFDDAVKAVREDILDSIIGAGDVDWKDDQKFADQLEKMVREMRSTFRANTTGVTFGQLEYIIEQIRKRA